jgi:hypothetical protein
MNAFFSIPHCLQDPWLPELFPLFEDVKKIAPPSAYDIVG